ncbi:MAG: MBL fold metallo-hydrolase [Chloroflexi bacterium]|nr:MBL fold metallo-hydrolase [Chloroflexota bacterium]
MRVQILGAHNTESRSTRLAAVLVDGRLALDAGGLTSSLSFRAQIKVRAVLLTHQHYDHIRDIPALAMNAYLRETAFSVYSTLPVFETLAGHFLNGTTYPKFYEKPPEKPAIDYHVIEAGRSFTALGYDVTAISVPHSVPAVGYQVTPPEGGALFYAGDTGPGLAGCWADVSPRALIIEVTAPDRFEDFAVEAKHLTPGLLGRELEEFRRLKGYLPAVVATHLNPAQEDEIKGQLARVAAALGADILPGREGLRLDL